MEIACFPSPVHLNQVVGKLLIADLRVVSRWEKVAKVVVAWVAGGAKQPDLDTTCAHN